MLLAEGMLNATTTSFISFFSWTRRRAAYHYIKKLKGKRRSVQQKLLHRLITRNNKETTKTKKIQDEAPDVPTAWRRDMLLAPATVHNTASSLAIWSVVGTLGVEPLKTQRFICFQMTHTPNTTRELKPFLTWPWTRMLEERHHSWNTMSTGCGTNSSRPTGCRRPS
jgi:hypothetical protein